uniref:Uncharacterized protein n=1 Tax=Trypanosoma vivax (strain Y486) TaxID=1055687 RepID=G0UAX3_TRYVY|nr:hypothetical protein, unlikely [Trypanosoma vivax Y486]
MPAHQCILVQHSPLLRGRGKEAEVHTGRGSLLKSLFSVKGISSPKWRKLQRYQVITKGKRINSVRTTFGVCLPRISGAIPKIRLLFFEGATTRNDAGLRAP